MSLKWSNPDLIRFEVVVKRQVLKNILQRIGTETTTYLFPWWLLKTASSSVAGERLLKTASSSVADEQLLKTASSSVADEQPGK